MFLLLLILSLSFSLSSVLVILLLSSSAPPSLSSSYLLLLSFFSCTLPPSLPLLRSWLLSEGLISSEGDLLDSSGMEGEWAGFHTPPSSSSPQTSSNAESCSSTTNPSSPLGPKKPPQSTPPTTPSPAHSSSSPSKTPVCPSKFSSPHRRRQQQRAPPAASLAKVTLEAPPSTPRPALYHHPYHPEPWTPESPILLLLSRFSHAADPSAALISSGAAAGLLHYLSQHPEPSGRCLRLLHRLSCNPNCLQALLRTGAPALIHHHLCREREGDSRQSERIKGKIRQLGETTSLPPAGLKDPTGLMML